MNLRANRFTWNSSVPITSRCMLIGLSLWSLEFQRFLFGNQTSLKSLDLSENELTGTFPQWLLQLNVKFLSLSDNNLHGSVPPRLFQPKYLRLDLSKTDFSGELPEIGESRLTSLSLSSNKFSGRYQSLSQMLKIWWC